jgi:catechol 2,3-dioxygenase-like lactoylglutathione lyase family enzyme
MKVQYVIKYVADMDAAVAFHRDGLGLPLRFASPHWSELDGGGVILALHLASAEKPAGWTQIGYRAEDLDAFHTEATARGVTFTNGPRDEHGQRLARFLDSEGAECGVSG